MAMLSVKPERVMAGTVEVEPAAIATVSAVLSTTVTELPVGLNTRVNFRLEETAISPGCGLSPATETTERESTSRKASTMFNTGRFVPVPVGNRGLETKTRNLRPLGLCVLAEEFLLEPQEIMLTLATTSTKMLTKILFKRGTPKSMKDRDLDARKRIITELLWRICFAAPALLARRC